MADDPPVLNQINLVVRDMEATVRFYRDLGLRVADEPAPWGLHHRTVATEEGLDFDFDSTGFAGVWSAGWPPSQAGVVFGFRVASRDDVDATYARLTALGHQGQQEPYDAFWGARYAIVTDPDGNGVGIMSPSDPDRRGAPPELPA